ncbi:MAG: MBL fold metallo-hydrolase, partial [Nitrososphaeria archaeon]|nr:MBL fold metallo-hydrolase [Nitrososphaeria archaeon]NIQ32131.1 MBL fold metallo-hydrolase [Nitrososphaeria archaeon]
MIFERVKSEGLAHISYFLGSDGEAIVIDPRRDCQVYIDLARRAELKIKYIFETHRNEDYVIGSCELAHFTGAKIYHGPGLDFKYGETLKDGQDFYFGRMRLTAIHTPGHTDESMSYALVDTSLNDEPIMGFSGDALFVGDVGRTDLYGPEEAPRLAENLYNSIFNKILPLGDGVILCPAHGAGSVCGGAISQREQSTLGLERLHNPILQKKKEDFIKFKVAERLERSPYFRKMEQYNLEGPPLLENLPDPPPLSPTEFQKRMEYGAVVLDTRTPSAFGCAHIEDSYSVWLRGIPMFAGWVLPYDKPVLLVLEDREHLETAVRYLIRLGYDRVEGYLCGGVEACGLESWYGEALPTEHLGLLTVQELKAQLDGGDNLTVLDVRSDQEWGEGHIEEALHIYVGHLEERLNEVPVDQPVAVICSVGNRASLAASILRRARHREVYTLLGGMTAWQKAGY